MSESGLGDLLWWTTAPAVDEQMDDATADD
jgi:hypothetical protein